MMVVGKRYGAAPECGRSYNTRDNKYEAGVSMESVCGLPGCNSIATLNGAKAYYYIGCLLDDRGGDDEYLIANVKKITKKDYTELLKTEEIRNTASELAKKEIESLTYLKKCGWNIYGYEEKIEKLKKLTKGEAK